MNISYEQWKTSIENGDFILVDDEKYDEFTKIYEKELENLRLCEKNESIVEKELQVVDIDDEVEEDDLLEVKRSTYITFIVWFLALCVVTLNATFHDSYEQVDTNIIENYDDIDITWLIL